MIFELARLDDAVHVDVVERERVAGRSSSSTVCVSPGSSVTLLKALQLLDRPRHRADAVADVHLHDLGCRRARRCS